MTLINNLQSLKTLTNLDSITLGAGCFWCVEGIFSRVNGVKHTQIGYGGGESADPTYTSVSSSPSGHAELTIVTFDTQETSLSKILTVFFAMHDPNKSYVINDKKGELYRSIILYKSEEQKIQILKFIDKYQKQESMYINTEILPFKNFKLADKKYQNYYSSNPEKPFCKNVIAPKLGKLIKKGIL